MKTISQVAELTGISVRTLQYYDEIDLLRPSGFTSSGYRLYDDETLQQLQQILFFKELDFKLKDIRDILQDPDFNKIEAFKKQKELLILRRERMSRLIDLLSELEKGESQMRFKEFDLSEYAEALEQFKTHNPDEVIKYWGSMEDFDELIQRVKDDKSDMAQMAIKQFGSIEKYTESMKYNMEHFSEIMARMDEIKGNLDEILQKNEDLHRKLTADLTRNPASEEVQKIVHEIVEMTNETNPGVDLGNGYWDFVIESCLSDSGKGIFEAKYGIGSSEYIAEALQYYFNKK